MLSAAQPAAAPDRSRLIDRLLAPLLAGAYPRRWRDGFGLILAYHRVVAEESDNRGRLGVARGLGARRLAEQLAWVARHFRPVPLARICAEEGPRFAVTFDDGYRDTLEVAAPVLARLGIPATVFVCAAHVGTDRWFWWERLAALVLSARPGIFELPRLADAALPERLVIGSDRAAAEASLNAALAPLPVPRIDEVLAMLADALRVALPPAAGRPDLMPSWPELRRLVATGWSVGGHGVEHSNHARPDRQAVAAEVAAALEACRAGLGAPVESYAWPYGRWQPAAQEALRRAGVALAVDSRRGVVSPASDPLALPRVQLHRPWRFAWAHQVEDARRRSALQAGPR